VIRTRSVASLQLALNSWFNLECAPEFNFCHQVMLTVPSLPITSQFVAVGERHVFVRSAGRGPALLLLHQSPQNSRALIPWIERLAPHYAVFAPDTPGFGYSDPLPIAEPEIPDFAAALDKLLSALGIERALVYGVHTGAVTAMRLALDFPQRVAGLVCDGYARFDLEEREDLLAHYLPPFEPAWDGGHLTFMFQRIREQNFFFPWHDARKAARLGYPIPATLAVHSNLLDVLDAGDGYRAGYRAPFLYDDATAVARLKVPTQIVYRAEDVLAPHKDRLPDLPDKVKVDLVEGGPSALIGIADAFFLAHGKDASVVESVKCVANARATSRHVAANGIAFRAVSGAGQGTCIVIGEIGHPARVPVTRDRYARTLVLDLPGHGASRDWSADRFSVDDVTQAIFAAVNDSILGNCTIVVHGGSAAWGAALASTLNRSGTHLCICDPVFCSAEQRDAFVAKLPSLVPTAEGGYLLSAWNWVRAYAIFSPWETTQLFGMDANKPLNVMAPAPRRVHAQVVEMLRAGPSFAGLWKSALSADLLALLKVTRLANVSIEVISKADSVDSADLALASMSANLAKVLDLNVSQSELTQTVWKSAP
jgi:pimeloyl-ACP methyl ester carboxylesterase